MAQDGAQDRELGAKICLRWPSWSPRWATWFSFRSILATFSQSWARKAKISNISFSPRREHDFSGLEASRKPYPGPSWCYFGTSWGYVGPSRAILAPSCSKLATRWSPRAPRTTSTRADMVQMESARARPGAIGTVTADAKWFHLPSPHPSPTLCRGL